MRGETWCFAACFSAMKNAPSFWDLFFEQCSAASSGGGFALVG
jgi:hypothetical protein